jgi:hypothetical protein
MERRANARAQRGQMQFDGADASARHRQDLREAVARPAKVEFGVGAAEFIGIAEAQLIRVGWQVTFQRVEAILQVLHWRGAGR